MLVDDRHRARGPRSLLQKRTGFRRRERKTPGLSRLQGGPDLVIMDLSMPGIGGSRHPADPWDKSARILVFTMHQSAAYAVQAIKAGARGFVIRAVHLTLLRAPGNGRRIALSGHRP